MSMINEQRCWQCGNTQWECGCDFTEVIPSLPFADVTVGKSYEIDGRICLVNEKTEYEVHVTYNDGTSGWVDIQDSIIYEL